MTIEKNRRREEEEKKEKKRKEKNQSSNPKCGRYTHRPTMNITPLCSSHNILPGGIGFIVIG